MAFLTGDVVPNPGGELPFKVQFMQGTTVLAEWPVESKQAGEQQIVEMIQEAAEDDEDDDDSAAAAGPGVVKRR